jgi:hypothetical protein
MYYAAATRLILLVAVVVAGAGLVGVGLGLLLLPAGVIVLWLTNRAVPPHQDD